MLPFRLHFFLTIFIRLDIRIFALYVAGWRANFNNEPSDFDFDVVIDAGGNENLLKIPKQVTRHPLAIGITANFKNKNTMPEKRAEEINGLLAAYDQEKFRDCKHKHKIDLENIGAKRTTSS